MAKTLKLIFLGAPGAGKGTQAELVSEKYNIPTISTGAILREAIASGSELGNLAKNCVESGALVPDDVIVGIVRTRLAEPDCKGGFILDGFPRTIAQAKALDETGIGISMVIDIEVEDERIIARMGGRRVCKDCGATYHTIYNPTSDNVHCNACGGELMCRRDDEPSVVAHRLETYHKETEPLRDYYANTGLLSVVEGQEKLEDTTALTLGVIEKYLSEN